MVGTDRQSGGVSAEKGEKRVILSFTCNGLTRRIQRLENAVVAVRQDSNVDTVRMIFRPEEFNNISLATVSVKFLYVDTDGEIKAYQTGTTPDGGVYVADWELTDDVVDDAGYINFAVKLAVVNGDVVEKQWFSIPDTFRVYDSVDDTNNPPGETAAEQATNAEKIAQLQSQLGTATSELSGLTSTVAIQGAQIEAVREAVDSANNLKLNKPTDDGTDGQFLRSNGDGTTRWGSGMDEAEVAAAVTEWLEENVSGGETIAVDKSLTVSDAAADAKVVGDELTGLKTDLDDVSKLYKWNLFDPRQLLLAQGWGATNGEYSGLISALITKYGADTGGIVLDGGFKENTQYAIRLKVKTSGSFTSGNMVHLRFYYSDNTNAGLVYFSSSFTSWTDRVAVSDPNKTVVKITFQYSNSGSANNTLYFKDFQIAEGDTQKDYSDFAHTAIDLQARESIRLEKTYDLLTSKVLNAKFKKGTVNYNGNISTDSGSATTILPNTVRFISIADGTLAHIILFNDTEYLGKINKAGVLDKVAGDWADFTGLVDMREIFSKFNATYAGFTVIDNNVTNDAEAVAVAKQKVAIYADDNSDYNTYVPPYFYSEMNTAIANVKGDMGACGKDGYSFIFTTDNHWNHNDGHSPAIIKAVQGETKIQDVILGGDLIDGSADKTHELDLLSKVTNNFYDPSWKLRYCFGNHDSNTVGQTSYPERHFTNGEVYMATQKHQEYDVHYSDDGFVDYYLDDETTKTRIIVVDSKTEGIALSASQLNWFTTTLASTPNGYRIIVFMHIWYEAAGISSQGEDISNAVDAWNATNPSAKVIALFGGHMHEDANYETNGGIPLVLTTSDLSVGSLFETVDSQAIDVITVNYTAKKINCRRIGKGADREIAWD